MKTKPKARKPNMPAKEKKNNKLDVRSKTSHNTIHTERDDAISYCSESLDDHEELN